MSSENFIYTDIETNGLNPSEIWCVVCRYKNINTVICNAQDFKDFQATVPHAIWVFHNGFGYDLPVLRRLWGVEFDRESIVDTLVLSRLANPSRDGGHSLRAWGERLGFPKGDYNDWSQLTPEMIDYCMRDTEVTEAVHREVLKELAGFRFYSVSGSRCPSIQLEHRVAEIMAKQERNGWLLDQRKATTLVGKFKEEMNDIEAELQAIFPPIVTKRFSEKRTNEDGTPKELKPHVEVFNPGSRQQIAKRLEAKGAKWTERTETGRPMVDENTLRANERIPEAKAVLRYLLLQKRESQVKSWVTKVKDDGRVHGRVNPIGAVTGRMTHQDPNMAQVPSSDALYGEDCRSCWIVPPGKKLVGFDASGLELRMLAHYMGDKEFTDVLLNEDIHTRNQVAAGLSTRPQAKTFIYAFLYGAGDPKIGAIVGGTARDGAKLKQKFLRNTPALKDLRERVGEASQRGYLVGLDGRHIIVRSEHASLNTLLQGAGAIVMKKALIILDDLATERGLDYQFCGNIHDEVQAEVATKDAEEFGNLGVLSLKLAGEAFNLRCPLDGEYKIGDSWAETH